MTPEFEITKRLMADAYSRNASKYGVARNTKFAAFLEAELIHFADSVKEIGTRTLDLGSGPGNEAFQLRQLGLHPVCIDNASGMVDQCKDKDLEAYLMDFWKLGFRDCSFAGAWMAFSLLHVPKCEAGTVIREVHRVLQPGGIFYVSLFEGEGEGLRAASIDRFGCERYFAYYRQQELEAVVSCENFKIRKAFRLEISPRPTISFECVKANC
jgi:ubiquinone/menaquinone biosynthesis C-methylase UbiE